MIVCDDSSAKLLNFLIDELAFADVPFQFGNPLAGDMRWRYGDAVSLVSSIVDDAKAVNGTVRIGAVDGSFFDADGIKSAIFCEVVIDS